MSLALISEQLIDISRGSYTPLIRSLTDGSSADTLRWVGKNKFTQRVRFCRLQSRGGFNAQYAGIALDNNDQIVVAGRATAGLWSGALLFSATGYILGQDDGGYFYEATLDLNTDSLNAALATTTGNQLQVTVDVDVIGPDASEPPRFTYQFPALILVPAYQGNESAPTSAAPLYPGPQGNPGLSVLNGAGAPENTLGRDGEFYLDTAARALYGPKVDGAWPTPPVSLVGGSIGTGLTPYQIKTANFVAEVMQSYAVDTTGGVVVITLPESPTTGQFMQCTDARGTWHSNPVTFTGGVIEGVMVDYVNSTQGTALALVYIDGNMGWRVCQAEPVITPGVVWVDASVGRDDTGRVGYIAHPFATLTAAITAADAAGASVIRLGAGWYPLDNGLLLTPFSGTVLGSGSSVTSIPVIATPDGATGHDESVPGAGDVANGQSAASISLVLGGIRIDLVQSGNGGACGFNDNGGAYGVNGDGGSVTIRGLYDVVINSIVAGSPGNGYSPTYIAKSGNVTLRNVEFGSIVANESAEKHDVGTDGSDVTTPFIGAPGSTNRITPIS